MRHVVQRRCGAERDKCCCCCCQKAKVLAFAHCWSDGAHAWGLVGVDTSVAAGRLPCYDLDEGLVGDVSVGEWQSPNPPLRRERDQAARLGHSLLSFVAGMMKMQYSEGGPA